MVQHFPNKASADFLALSSSVTVDKTSAAVRQKWQTKTVIAGAPWGRLRGRAGEGTVEVRAEAGT